MKILGKEDVTFMIIMTLSLLLLFISLGMYTFMVISKDLTIVVKEQRKEINELNNKVVHCKE